MADAPILLYSTLKNKQEAKELAAALLAERLIACANLIPGVTSLYEWEGEMEENEEVILLAKTTSGKAEKAIARIAELHSYSCPCAVGIPLTLAHPPFAQWVAAQTL